MFEGGDSNSLLLETMKYTLLSVLSVLLAAICLGVFFADRGKNGDPIVIDGIGVVEIRMGEWKNGQGGQEAVEGGKRFLHQIYGWYVRDELVPHPRDLEISKTISDSIKNNPAIVVSHGKIPYKKFWIPVVSRPALIGIEGTGGGVIELFSLPNMDEISVDFVKADWPE